MKCQSLVLLLNSLITVAKEVIWRGCVLSRFIRVVTNYNHVSAVEEGKEGGARNMITPHSGNSVCSVFSGRQEILTFWHLENRQVVLILNLLSQEWVDVHCDCSPLGEAYWVLADCPVHDISSSEPRLNMGWECPDMTQIKTLTTVKLQ